MSIYDQIGGAPAVSAAVDSFYLKVTSDPALGTYFSGADMGRLKGHQRAFIAAALGGPAAYKGRDMASAHASLQITDAEFDAVVGYLVQTLAELQVPAEIIDRIGETLSPLRSSIVAEPAQQLA